MGDEGYVALSDRIRAEGKAEGRAEERAKRRTEMRSIISHIIDKGKSIQEAAELTGISVEEIQELIGKK